jgi:hypothetical protein
MALQTLLMSAAPTSHTCHQGGLSGSAICAGGRAGAASARGRGAGCWACAPPADAGGAAQAGARRQGRPPRTLRRRAAMKMTPHATTAALKRTQRVVR